MADMVQHSLLEGVVGALRSRRKEVSISSGNPCDGCPLNDGRRKLTSAGNPDTAKFVVVGGAAERADERAGAPFSGESGAYLCRVLREEAGIDSGRDVYWANVRRCTAGEGELSEAQERQVAKRCGAYVVRELAGIPLSVPVVGIGNAPLFHFFGVRGVAGERMIVRKMAEGRKYVPVVLPGQAVQKAGSEEDGVFREDVRKLRAWRSGNGGVSGSFTLVQRDKDLAAVTRMLLAAPLVFFDLETPALHPWGIDSRQVGILAAGFCVRPGEAWGIPLAYRDSPLGADMAWRAVRDILAGPQRKGALHGQHDVSWVRWFGGEVSNFAYDDMLAATLLADRPYTEIRSNLLRLASDWLGEIEYPWLDVDKSRMAEYPLETVAGIAMTDAEWEFRIHGKLMAALVERRKI